MGVWTGEKLLVGLYSAEGVKLSSFTKEALIAESYSEFVLPIAAQLPAGSYIRLHGTEKSTGSWTRTYRVGRYAGLPSVEGATLPARPPETGDLVPFATWADVLEWVRAKKIVFYQAPLNVRPTMVRASVRGAGKKVRIAATSRDSDAFWADSGHLSRFLKRKG
jgi:hypothetical protein